MPMLTASPSSVRTRSRISAAIVRARTEQPLAAADIEKGLVDGYRLDPVGEAGEDRHHRPRNFPVTRHAHRPHHRLRAAAQRHRHRQGGMDPEGPRLVGAGTNHPPVQVAADDDRAATQRRFIELLHGGVEGIHVGVQNLA